MRPFPLLAAVVGAAVVLASVVHAEHWLGDNVALVVVAYLAAAVIAFSWFDLWSTRERS